MTDKKITVQRSAFREQTGQTIIETLAAIFILVTTLTVGLGLAVFVLSNSQKNIDEVIATNLTREGTDVIRMMRDTNWLESDAKGIAPWPLAVCADIGNRLCYSRAWQGVTGGTFHGYDIRTNTYRAKYDAATKTWSLGTNTNYNLYLQSDGSYTHTVNGTSKFARKIVITEDPNPPYTPLNSNSELVVKSVVGWRGKNCTAMVSQDPSTTNCKIVVEERFTNWKDYR